MPLRVASRAPSIVRHGLRSAAALVERALGVHTRGIVQLEELGEDDFEREGYEPSGWIDLRRILPPKEVSTDDVFLDLGAGKGKALLMAACYPFARIIGVELSEHLSAVARGNVAAAPRRLRPERIEVIHADALTYEIPDDVTVVYLYNPFRGETFSAAIDRLIDSVDRCPRAVRLVYLNAKEHDRLLATGRIRLERVVGRIRLDRRDPSTGAYIRLYVLEPSASQDDPISPHSVRARAR